MQEIRETGFDLQNSLIKNLKIQTQALLNTDRNILG